MDDFPEENDLRSFSPFQNHSHTGGLASRIELGSKRLEGGLVCGAILQADGEWSHLVHHSPTSL